MSHVILVDPADRPIGTAEKMRAHRDGVLHRAFSIFLFRSNGSMLLQQRALAKYHSGGLWSNTCCSHPEPGDALERAAHRRLRKEMGMDCELHGAFAFIYRAELGRGLYEHELDHVLIGQSDEIPVPDPGEVSSWRDVHPADLEREIDATPELFTVWFLIALRHLLAADLWNSPRSEAPRLELAQYVGKTEQQLIERGAGGTPGAWKAPS